MYWSPFTEYTEDLNKFRDLSEKALAENDKNLVKRLNKDELGRRIMDRGIEEETLIDGLRAFGKIVGERTVPINSKDKCPAGMVPAINTANAEMPFPRAVLQSGIICVPRGQAGVPSDKDLKNASYRDLKAYLDSFEDPEEREREIKRLSRNEIITSF